MKTKQNKTKQNLKVCIALFKVARLRCKVSGSIISASSHRDDNGNEIVLAPLQGVFTAAAGGRDAFYFVLQKIENIAGMRIMNMKKLVLTVALASGMTMGTANAADQGHGKITFKGTIIDAACSIDADSLDQTKQLGSISMKQLADGGKSTPINFDIQLHDCDTTTSKNATVAFNGVAGDSSAGLDSALAVTGQGSGVGVVITDMGGNVIKPNTASPQMALNDGENDLQFQAYVQGASASGTVVPGAFTSVANFVMSYK